jgi:hypothetical protein
MIKLRILSIVSASVMGVSLLGGLAQAYESQPIDAQGAVVARKGADDPPGDNRGVDVARHGADDPAVDNHGVDVARKGADDPPGDNRGVDS